MIRFIYFITRIVVFLEESSKLHGLPAKGQGGKGASAVWSSTLPKYM